MWSTQSHAGHARASDQKHSKTDGKVKECKHEVQFTTDETLNYG